MHYLFLVLGFGLLIKGADLLVDGSSSMARKFKVPPILVGLTIVAFGTSAPEAAVSINAAIKGANEIAIGNVLGSNIFNILMVIGFAAIISPLKIQRLTILKEFPFAILSSVIIVILSADIILDGQMTNTITRGDGLVLLGMLCIFMYYLVELAIKSESSGETNIKDISTLKSVLYILIGLIGIIYGADLVVKSSSTIALNFGISEKLVGLTFVAIGTSLPELVTSIVAAFKKESDIAMGNVIGSNLFNYLFVIGVSSTIRPINVQPVLLYDASFVVVITIITYIFAITNKTINKREGILLVFLYIVYMGYIIYRN